MGFEGSLDSVSFSDILNTLCKMKKEGTLVVSNDKKQKIIHFLDNGVTLIGDNQVSLIGERLVQDGKLKEWQLDNAIQEQQDTGKELELILLEQGLVSEEEIESLIYEYMEEEICDIFFWENARFSFTDGPPPNSLVNENKMTFIFDVQSLLFRIAEQLEEWNQIREKIPSLDIVFVVKENVSWAEGNLEAEFKQIRELLDGTHDVRDVIRITSLSVIAVCRLFSLMLLQNLIQQAEYEDFITRSEVAQSKGKIQLQVELLKRALALNPKDSALMIDIAKAYESISNGKKASEWYLKAAKEKDDTDEAIKYVEIAIRYDGNAVEPRKELLSLLKSKNNVERMLDASVNLARMYRSEGEIGEAIEILEELLLFSSNEIVYEELTNLYIDSQDSVKAFGTYKDFVENSKKEHPELLKKISCIPNENKTVEREILAHQKALDWEHKRGKIYAVSAVVIVVGLIISYIVLYELSARSRYEMVKVFFQTKKYEKTKETCNEIINDYSWSSVVEDAKLYIQKVDQYYAAIEKKEKALEKQQLDKILKEIDSVKEFVKMELFDEAKIQLEKYHEEYNTIRWRNLHGRINHHIDECRIFIAQTERDIKKKKREDAKVMAIAAEKDGNIDEALEKWRELRKYEEYQKEAEKSIQRMEKNEISLRKENIKKVFLIAEEAEKQGEFVNAYEKYTNVEKLIQKIKTKNLEEQDIYYVTDVLQLVENGKKRIEQLDQQVKLKWNEVLQLRKQGDYELSFRKTMEILKNPRLSKTTFAKDIKAAVYISTSPQGAKVANSKLVTPCFYELETAQTLTLVHSSFQSVEAKVDLSSAYFHFQMEKKKNWKKDTNARIATTPIITGDYVLVINTRGSVIAIDKETGKGIWEFKTRTGFGDILGGVSRFDNNIYLGSNDNHLYSVDITNGEKKWMYNADYFVQCTPAVDEKNVFFGTAQGDIYSLDRYSGKKVWQSKIPGSITTKPIIWRREVIFASSNYIVGVDLFTGKVNWQKELTGKIAVDPVFREEIAYFVTDRKHIYCFDIDKKEKLWHKLLEGKIEASPILWGKNLYLHDTEGFLYRLIAANGETEWRNNIEVISRSPLAISNDKNTMYATNNKGNIISLDFDGNIVWTDRLLEEKTNCYVLTTDKILFFFSQTGQIYSLQD